MGGVIKEELYKHVTLFLWIIGPFIVVSTSKIFLNYGATGFIKSIFGKPLPSFILIDGVLLKHQTKQTGQELITSLENKGLSNPANGLPLWMGK